MSPFLQSFLDRDRKRLQELEPQLDAPSREVVELHRSCLTGDWRRQEPQRLTEVVERILSTRMEDRDLWTCLLASVLCVTAQRGLLDLADRLSSFIESIRHDGAPPEVALYVGSERARFEHIRGDLEQALALSGSLLALPVDAGHSARVLCLSLHCWVAAELYRFDVAHEDLAALARLSRPPAERSLNPTAYLRFFVAFRQARLDEALEQVRLALAAPGTVDPRRIRAFELQVLGQLGRYDEQRQVMDRQRELAPDSPVLACLLAERALAEGALGAAASSIRDAQHKARDGTIYERQWADLLLLEWELASRHTTAAAEHLGQLDSKGGSIVFASARARLAAQCGRPAEAVSELTALREVAGITATLRELRFAHELPGSILWLVCPGVVAQTATKTDSAPPLRPADSPGYGLAGSSEMMQQVRDLIAMYAPTDMAVLITGETGTGKELVARALHAAGDRADRPFLAIHCAGFADTLIESELFGHVRGAFTGAERNRTGILEAAGDGTILLDEVDSMTPRLQALLLRVLETGDFRAVGDSRSRHCGARIIAAARDSIDRAVADGSFRDDLYYRLNQSRIRLPPLRQHREDLAELVAHVAGGGSGDQAGSLPREALEALERHDWKGNVRELRSVVRRLLLLAGTPGHITASLVRQCLDTPVRVDSAGAQREMDASAGGLEGGRKARERIRRILALFDERQECTRAEVIRLLDCAPNTATRDLRLLEAEGRIERVNPTRHPRTAYFVRKPGGAAR